MLNLGSLEVSLEGVDPQAQAVQEEVAFLVDLDRPFLVESPGLMMTEPKNLSLLAEMSFTLQTVEEILSKEPENYAFPMESFAETVSLFYTHRGSVGLQLGSSWGPFGVQLGSSWGLVGVQFGPS